MKVSYQWLKEYVKIDIDPEDLAARLTMAGLAVEHVESLGQRIAGVVVGEILEMYKHPEANKLVICRVDLGAEVVQIVTGAENVKPGHRVPVAKVGGRLPGGVHLKKAVLRGVDSFGMLCSAAELNIDEELVAGESRGGILILSPDSPVGADIVQVLHLDDAVLEFELTPNRSDCLSVINIAREVGAVLGREISLPAVEFPETTASVHEIAAVEVDDPDLCNRYVARVVQDVKLGPSPQWMQHYLRCAGVRPINNVVDISNFVMLEMGQPLHTFDYDRLAGHKIIVRRAREGEEMWTLDGQKRVFNSDTLLICDAERPVAVAGVMGGLDTEVTDRTRNILIESARFHPVSIRRTSRYLGLRSEASLRFEKGLDVHNAVPAANRAAQLLRDLAGGKVVRGAIDSFAGKEEKIPIILRTARVNEILGTDLSTKRIASLITRLHFPAEIGAEEMKVTVPSYRQDISREIDLIEEVARLNGYDKIPVTLPSGTATEGKKTWLQAFEEQTRDLLNGSGLMEVITYSFISPKDFDRINLPRDSSLRHAVEIKNPLSDEQSVMRTTLLPGLLEVAARNTKRRNVNLAVYEWGRIFLPGPDKLPQEPLMLGGLVSGKIDQGWNWPPQILDFYYLKGVLAGIFQHFGIKDWSMQTDSLPPFLHPGRSGHIFLGRTRVGLLGEIHPLVQDNYDLENRTYVFQIELWPVHEASLGGVKYVPVPKYPAVERDMALVVKDSLAAERIERVIWQNGARVLTGVNLFDVYKGAQIAEGYKSLAYSLTFQAEDRTLTDDEVSEVFTRIKERLATKFAVELR